MNILLRITAVAVALLGMTRPSYSETRIITETSQVQDLLLLQGMLWTATQGGVEAYDLSEGRRVLHYTTLDGLNSNDVWKLQEKDGALLAFTQDQRCLLVEATFKCAKRAAQESRPITIGPRFQGARVTKTLPIGEDKYVATLGAGVWKEGKSPRRLTPKAQICSNHVMSMAKYRGRIWYGSFDEGLCSSDLRASKFIRQPGEFRMINDLEVTPKGLFIASAEGLYRTVDGKNFTKVDIGGRRAVNGLSRDGRFLWVTSPGALTRILLRGKLPSRNFWRPGTSRSLQKVDAYKGDVWIATEDRGLLRFEGGRFTVYDKSAGLPSSWALDVAIGADRRAYVATLRDGIIAVNVDGTFESIPGIPGDWGLFVGRFGQSVWAGMQGGSAEISGAQVLPVDDLPNPNVHAVMKLGHKIFVATERGLLLRKRPLI